MPLILGIIASSLIKAITDTFTRANAATLGSAESGQAWSVLRGTGWGVASNAASNTTDAASSYPLASIQGPNLNLTMEVTSMGNGPGIAFWVTDANNWWGVYQNRVDTVVNPPSYYAGDYSPPSYYAGQYSPPSYDAFRGYYYAGFYIPPSFFAGSYSPPSYYAGSSTIAYSLNLIKAVAGTISSVATQALGATQSLALRVVTSGLSITATGYTNTTATTQNGTALTNTQASATTTSKTGILIAPSSNGQSQTIDSFTAK